MMECQKRLFFFVLVVLSLFFICWNFHDLFPRPVMHLGFCRLRGGFSQRASYASLSCLSSPNKKPCTMVSSRHIRHNTFWKVLNNFSEYYINSCSCLLRLLRLSWLPRQFCCHLLPSLLHMMSLGWSLQRNVIRLVFVQSLVYRDGKYVVEIVSF